MAAPAIHLETFDQLHTADIPAPGWIWGEIIERQSLTVVHTGPKRGKSMLTMNLALAYAAGIPEFLNFSLGGPGRVVIFQREVHRHGMQHRLRRMIEHAPFPIAADALSRISHNFSRALRLHDLAVFQRFREVVRALKPDLVILDPLAHVLVTNENDNAEVGRALERIAELRDDPGCAIVVVHHNRKESETTRGVDPSQNARGADRIVADADAVLSLVRGPKHPSGPFSNIHCISRNSAGTAPFGAVFNKQTMWWERAFGRGDLDRIARWVDDAGGVLGRKELIARIEEEWKLGDPQHRAASRYVEKAIEAGVLAQTGATFTRPAKKEG